MEGNICYITVIYRGCEGWIHLAYYNSIYGYRNRVYVLIHISVLYGGIRVDFFVSHITVIYEYIVLFVL